MSTPGIGPITNKIKSHIEESRAEINEEAHVDTYDRLRKVFSLGTVVQKYGVVEPSVVLCCIRATA